MAFRKFIFMPIPICRECKNKNKKKLEIRDGRQEQWKHTSTPFFFFPLQFSYENSETFLAIYFLRTLSICRIMNAKKKTRNSSQKTRDHGFFFSFTTFFLWILRKISYYLFFFCFSPSFRPREIISSQDKFFAVPFLRGT